MERLLHLCYSTGLCWSPFSFKTYKKYVGTDLTNSKLNLLSMSTFPPKLALTALEVGILVVAHYPIWVVHSCVAVPNC